MCGIKMEKHRRIKLMGTTIDLTVRHQEAEKTLDELVDLLYLYNKRFSANDSTSELAQVNKNAGIQAVKVHPELYELIKIGKEHSLALESSLNITIGPLVQSWRIGFQDAQKPSDKIIREKLEIIDPDQVVLSKDHVYLTKKGMAIDLGALAKGYIADRLIDYLKSVKADSALINLGGNLVTMGPAFQHEDRLWRIGIQNPVKKRGHSQLVLKIRDQSVVTSGIYERLYTENGQSYHHIFNSKTGYPIDTEIASLTIISNLSVEGEIWTSRLFGQSRAQIIKQLNALSKIEGIVIDQQGKVYYSEGVNQLLL